MNSIAYGVLGYAGCLAPLSNRFNYAIKLDPMVCATVVLLPLLIGPMAIGLAVVTIVIASIYRMPMMWPWSHVGGEHREIHPLGTYLDPTPAVARPFLAFWVGAAVDHVPPRLVERVFRWGLRKPSIGSIGIYSHSESFSFMVSVILQQRTAG